MESLVPLTDRLVPVTNRSVSVTDKAIFAKPLLMLIDAEFLRSFYQPGVLCRKLSDPRDWSDQGLGQCCHRYEIPQQHSCTGETRHPPHYE